VAKKLKKTLTETKTILLESAGISGTNILQHHTSIPFTHSQHKSNVKDEKEWFISKDKIENKAFITNEAKHFESTTFSVFNRLKLDNNQIIDNNYSIINVNE